MARTLSNSQRRTLDARRSPDVYLWLATFKHADLAEPILIARNAEDVVSQGKTFHKGWFDFEPPDDAGTMPRGRMAVPNIDGVMGALLLRLRDPVRVRLQSVLRSGLDAVIEDYDFLYLLGISGTETAISGSLEAWQVTGHPWPARTGTKARFPGAWI